MWFFKINVFISFYWRHINRKAYSKNCAMPNPHKTCAELLCRNRSEGQEWVGGRKNVATGKIDRIHGKIQANEFIQWLCSEPVTIIIFLRGWLWVTAVACYKMFSHNWTRLNSVANFSTAKFETDRISLQQSVFSN